MLRSLGLSALSGLKLGPSQEEPEETLKLKLSVIPDVVLGWRKVRDTQSRVDISTILVNCNK